MFSLSRVVALGFVFGVLAGSVSSSTPTPETAAHIPAQAVADALREVTEAEIAFVPAAVIRADVTSTNLVDLVQFPTDEVVVVTMTGAQVRQALERSVALHPSPNPGFLQLSGLTASYSRSAAPDKRIVEVLVAGVRLSDARSYSVAMPGSLARGGLGYFRIWNREQITRVYEALTLETALRGRGIVDRTLRWTDLP